MAKKVVVVTEKLAQCKKEVNRLWGLIEKGQDKMRRTGREISLWSWESGQWFEEVTEAIKEAKAQGNPVPGGFRGFCERDYKGERTYALWFRGIYRRFKNCQ